MFLLMYRKNMNSFHIICAWAFAILHFTTGFRMLPRCRQMSCIMDSCVIEWEQGEVSWDFDDDVEPVVRKYVPPLSNDYVDGECKIVESTNMSYVVCSTEANNTVSFQIQGNIDKMYIDAVRFTLNDVGSFTEVLSNYEVFMEENPEFTIMLLTLSTYAKTLNSETGALMALQKIVRGILISIVVLLKGAKSAA